MQFFNIYLNQMSLHPVTSLPRDGDRYSPTESAPKPDDISKEVAEADPPNVDFDLHIAESFNIPLLSIDEQRTALNKDKVEIKNKEVPKPEQPKLKTKENLPVKQVWCVVLHIMVHYVGGYVLCRLFLN